MIMIVRSLPMTSMCSVGNYSQVVTMKWGNKVFEKEKMLWSWGPLPVKSCQHSTQEELLTGPCWCDVWPVCPASDARQVFCVCEPCGLALGVCLIWFHVSRPGKKLVSDVESGQRSGPVHTKGEELFAHNWNKRTHTRANKISAVC